MAGFGLAPAAKADASDKKTIVTFSAPVEVPGRILAPGTYVFKLANMEADHDLVMILSQDEKEVMTTTFAVPVDRLEPVDQPSITLSERPSGSLEAVKDWFYPGEETGLEFVYPNQ